jgi:hypothetical protein
MAKKRSTPQNKAGKKLLNHAINEFFFFEEDWIEDELDAAFLKFAGKRRWRISVRSHLWNKPKVRNAIIDIACKMFRVEPK